MQQAVFIRKLRSAIFRAQQKWQERHASAARRRRTRLCREWAETLHDADVLIGANFVEFGGTRHHMHAITDYSSLKVELVPSEDLLKSIQLIQFKYFGSEFQNFDFPSLQAVHSHVFPWFIEWCSQHRERTGVRWVHTHHNWYYPEFAREELEPWQIEFNEGFKFALQNADVCLSVSKRQRRFLRESFDFETHYLPNGVRVKACDLGDATRFVRKNGISDFILYAGRNDPVKNPADFVRLAQAMPSEQFLMIGQGLSDDVMTSEWDVEVPANLTIRGEASHAELQDALAACKALVVTSRREGLPTLVLESMAHQKPTIVPNEAGCMEAIGDGEFGYIYEQDDITDLAQKTVLAIADETRCQRARQRVLVEYDWPVIAKKLDHIYQTGQVI